MKFKGILLLSIVICEVFGQSLDCGIKDELVIDIRIVGGDPVNHQASWPWLVAFFNKFTGLFFCSGSLISQKHVVSGEFDLFLKGCD